LAFLQAITLQEQSPPPWEVVRDDNKKAPHCGASCIDAVNVWT